MFRWGEKLILLVLCLAALVACGDKKTRQNAPAATYGMLACDYVANSKQRNLGNFDVQIVLTNANKTYDKKKYLLYVTPVSLAHVGDILTVTVAGADGVYRMLREQIRLTQGKAVPLAYLDEDELLKYSTLIIAVYQPGVGPLESTASRLNICPLVQPGDGVNQTASTI